MKKIFIFLLTFFILLSLTGCNDNNDIDDPIKDPIVEPETPEEPTNPTEPEEPLIPPTVELEETDENLGFAIHFNVNTKSGSNYTYNLWLWEKGLDGADYQFNEEDSYGVVARYKWSDGFNKDNELGFIVKENKVWQYNPKKDVSIDRFIDFSSFTLDKYGYYNIYLKTGDENIYTSEDGIMKGEITKFNLLYHQADGYKLNLTTNIEYESYEIKLGDELIYSSIIQSDDLYSKTEKTAIYKLGTEMPDLFKEYTVKVVFKNINTEATKIADKSVLYYSQQFIDNYTYNGDLGALYSFDKTIFRVWSPIATAIKLRIYNSGTPTSLGGDDFYYEYEMTKGINGTWEYELSGNLEGKYYTYVVSNYLYTNEEIVDPYAKSTGINGLRGMIVDFSKTNPEGWDDINILEYKSTELTVYETHIADLTSSSTWNGNVENKTLYKGFYEEGTTYTKGDVTVKTGFDHIKELGVNAVQLIPIFDQANDERKEYKEFNWGYNPLNYNSLDGIYSSNPYDGYVKIQEFKELVMAYNKAGINIIMDVVYNHVNGLEKSNFDVLMPKYYFRYSNGLASNGSGCGNETASEMVMFRKFMIDSTQFWASEYKLGGFRFDLMGIHDVTTMNEIANNLHTNVNEYITIYGEPWAGGEIALSGKPANQSNMNLFEGYGCFNDKMRDALIKGGLSDKSEKGWITKTASASGIDVLNIKAGISGKIFVVNNVIEPEKCINYVTCHDNYTLYDRIKAAGITNEDTIKKMAMLSNSIVFTSQGVSFMLAGEEFLRTKGGNSNSYNASYEVNELNYALKVDNLDLFKNYQKLIKIKQNSNIFGKSGNECAEIVVNSNSKNNMIYYDLVDEVNNVSYRIIHSNGVTGEKTIDLEGYTLYLDTLNANIELTSSTTILEYQTIIAYKELN